MPIAVVGWIRNVAVVVGCIRDVAVAARADDSSIRVNTSTCGSGALRARAGCDESRTR